MYNDRFDAPWDARFAEKLKFDGFPEEIANQFSSTDYTSLIRSMISFCDGVNIASEQLDADLQAVFDEATCLKQSFVPEEKQAAEIGALFDSVIAGNVLA